MFTGRLDQKIAFACIGRGLPVRVNQYLIYVIGNHQIPKIRGKEKLKTNQRAACGGASG
jgi:hypothetical protein